METKTKRRFLIVLVGVLIALGATGAGVWAYLRFIQPTVKDSIKAEVFSADAYKYVGTQKIVAMLRSDGGSGETHYAVLDVVFKTNDANEAATRAQLLLLRSVIASTVSTYTLDAIRHASMEHMSAVINDAFDTSYQSRKVEKPFDVAMIEKLLAQ